ncbi:hypothetical protein MF451_003813 [Salmonella enterica subsp. enterica serovar Saintpaul]|nr:hypothetical protein [Salmonella enterica subsp. enterica serovar Saintpaul]
MPRVINRARFIELAGIVPAEFDALRFTLKNFPKAVMIDGQERWMEVQATLYAETMRTHRNALRVKLAEDAYKALKTYMNIRAAAEKTFGEHIDKVSNKTRRDDIQALYEQFAPHAIRAKTNLESAIDGLTRIHNRIKAFMAASIKADNNEVLVAALERLDFKANDTASAVKEFEACFDVSPEGIERGIAARLEVNDLSDEAYSRWVHAHKKACNKHSMRRESFQNEARGYEEKSVVFAHAYRSEAREEARALHVYNVFVEDMATQYIHYLIQSGMTPAPEKTLRDKMAGFFGKGRTGKAS